MNLLEYKLKKILSWKSFSYFKSFFKWQWIEVEDFREYQPGDDKKAINWKMSAKQDTLIVNLFKKEKDTDINIYFDLNSNWFSWNSNLYIDKVWTFFLDIVKFSSKYRTKVKTSYDIWNWLKINLVNKDLVKAHNLIKTLKNTQNNIWKKFISNLEKFINYEKKISKKHIIIIFSDFLSINNKLKDELKVLWEKNEIFLIRLSLDLIQWNNFNLFSLNKAKIDFTKTLQFIDI